MVATLEQALEIITQQRVQLRRLAQLEEQVRALSTALSSAQATITRQQHQINAYIDRLYGRKSERWDPNQLSLALVGPTGADEPVPVPAAEKDPPQPPSRPPRRRRPHGRLPIPEHLEREIIELDVPESERVCPVTGRPLKRIGYEDTERLEYTPSRAFVRVYRRWKYAAPDPRHNHRVGIVTASLPDHPIPRCKADPGLIAYAIVSKFADHLPFYRQEDIFAREGVRLPRSTLDGWAIQTGEVLRPLGEQLKRTVLDTDVLFTDDSTVPLLEKGRGRTRQARMWVYIRGGTGPPLTAYDFTLDRKKQRPLEYLKGYQGYVHADAYSGYDQLFTLPGLIEVGCWAHARRGFIEAMKVHPEQASQIVALIAQLYQREKTLQPLQPEKRRRGRQDEIAPLLKQIFQQVQHFRRHATPRDPLHKACEYMINQRQALMRFLEDGRLKIDNNTAENAIRPLAVGRKNWLFAGSQRGGHVAALYLGLIQSCKACGVEPWTYLDDVLRRIMSHPINQLRQLLPDLWTPLPRNARGMIQAAFTPVPA